MRSDPSEKQLYVAEVKAPSYFHVESEVRDPLPNPGGFEVSKGYWIVRPPDEQSAVEGYANLALTILFSSKTLKDAEDHALKVGRLFSDLTSAFGGYPLGPPRLSRIASVDLSEKLLTQHNYSYDDRLHESLGGTFAPIVQHRYLRYLEAFSSTDGDTRYRLQLALHWYGIAVSADDPIVSYVAAWTGLECIGLVMDLRFHTQGSKAPCRTCGNEAGKDRDRTMAGIEHGFNSETIEPIEGFSHEKAHQLRNDVVHGLRPRELLVQDCSTFRQFLIDLLNATILTALSPPEYSQEQSIRSIMAGDYENRPCSRASIKFRIGQVSPYLGEWIQGNVRRQSRRGTYGDGKPDLEISINSAWGMNEEQCAFVEARSYEEFRRSGFGEYPLPDGNSMPAFIPWQDRPSWPAWKSVSGRWWESGQALQA